MNDLVGSVSLANSHSCYDSSIPDIAPTNNLVSRDQSAPVKAERNKKHGAESPRFMTVPLVGLPPLVWSARLCVAA